MESLGEVAVETGKILMVDPCHLFSQREWREVVIPMGKTMGEGRVGLNKAVLKLLSIRTGDPEINLEELAVIAGTGGDASFKVTKSDEGLKVHL